MKLLFTCCLASLIFISCQKETSEEVVASNYFPVTTGSNWTYQPSQGAAYTITATSRDTTALGITYKVYSSTDGQNRFRAKTGNDYYQFLVVPQILPTGVNELYLKDNQPVGATWSFNQTVSVPNFPIPLTITLAYNIKAKDSSMTVNSKVYTKVIRVGQDISVQGFGSVGTGNFYYADQVGLIKSDLNISVPGQAPTTASESLVSYEIK